MATKRVKKYIDIVEIAEPPFAPKKKTKKWAVVNILTHERLGEIRWYGGWRKYVYFNDTVGYCDWDFMRMVADFCEARTNEHYHL